jgi:hypothetical protein
VSAACRYGDGAGRAGGGSGLDSLRHRHGGGIASEESGLGRCHGGGPDASVAGGGGPLPSKGISSGPIQIGDPNGLAGPDSAGSGTTHSVRC